MEQDNKEFVPRKGLVTAILNSTRRKQLYGEKSYSDPKVLGFYDLFVKEKGLVEGALQDTSKY